jgi:hypothetical protein
MSGAILPLPQYAFVAWLSVKKAQGLRASCAGNVHFPPFGTKCSSPNKLWPQNIYFHAVTGIWGGTATGSVKLLTPQLQELRGRQPVEIRNRYLQNPSVYSVTATQTQSVSPSWEADSHLATQEISPLLMETEGSLPCSQQPDTGPYPEPDESSPHPQVLPISDTF